MKKNTRRKKDKGIKGKLERLLEMPREVTSNEPKITVLGFDQILVENYKGILEYEDYYIKLNTFIGAVNINGFALSLNQMTEDDIMITGKIDSMEFESAVDEEE